MSVWMETYSSLLILFQLWIHWNSKLKVGNIQILTLHFGDCNYSDVPDIYTMKTKEYQRLGENSNVTALVM